MTHCRKVLPLLAVALLFIGSNRSYGQETTKLTNDDVIEMVRSGLSEQLILSKIRSSPPGFLLGAQDLIDLKKAGVSEKTIQAMMEVSSRPAIPVRPWTAPAGDSSAADRAVWLQRYNSARSKRSSGLVMDFLGLGLSGTGLYLSLTAKETVSVYDPFRRLSVTVEQTNKGKAWGGLVGGITGGVLSIWGFVRVSHAVNEIHALEAEARRKGYITLGPSHTGIGIMVAYKF